MKAYFLLLSFIFATKLMAVDMSRLSKQEIEEIYHQFNGDQYFWGCNHLAREEKARKVIREFSSNKGMGWSEFSLGCCSKPAMEVGMAYTNLLLPSARPLSYEEREYVWAKRLLQKPRGVRAREAYKRAEGCSIL